MAKRILLLSAILFLISPLRSSATYYWPISGSSDPDGWAHGLCSAYGYRNLDGTYDFHHGLDIIADVNDPVYATFNGTVEARTSLNPKRQSKK